MSTPSPHQIPKDDNVADLETQRPNAPSSNRIPPSPNEALVDASLDEEVRLALLATARDQDELERDIGRQADQLLTEQADSRDNKRLEKTETQKQKLEAQLAKVNERLGGPGGSTVKNLLRNEKANLEAQISKLEIELGQIRGRIADRHKDDDRQDGGDGTGTGRLPGETRREYLIRTGKITPFSKIAQVPRTSSNLADVMLDAEQEDEDMSDDEVSQEVVGPVSHRELLEPGLMDEESSDSMPTTAPLRHRTKRRRLHVDGQDVNTSRPQSSSGERSEGAFSQDEYEPPQEAGSESSAHDDVDSDYDLDAPPSAHQKTKSSSSRSKKRRDELEKENLTGIDDGNENNYKTRLEKWCKKRKEARRRKAGQSSSLDEEEDQTYDDTPEWMLPHPTRLDAIIDGDFKIPGDIYPSLFDYQKTGVRWLWELYSQQVGGIIGDEMGLGKTIQIISFLAGLHYSGKLSQPVIIVAPATVMKQWVNEFHRWWPPLRVSILHTSGSGMLNLRRETEIEDELEDQDFDDYSIGRGANQSAAKKIVDRAVRHGHVLVTTYSGLQTYSDLLLRISWQYAVLDEGHKIRNPNTAITLHCKELRTPNRIILSGTPMQNNLTELWSLFDFVFPMRLGTLVTFRQQFEGPIKQGGYANASNLQVETAMKCAETLKDAISPYLLQRFKVDVAADLPKKSERVLFCKLTSLQRTAYRAFLKSNDMQSIMAGKRQPLYGIDIIRKICNHPDLVDHKRLSQKADYEYGDAQKSGKMQVVKAVLEIWKKGGHKTLLFAQHRIMLDILERFIRRMDGFNYLRMDGNTSIKERQNLVDKFNRSPNIHVFLLTTKVGGLGVNLTGADRVIIYDPDWNPSTDIQARERAWRLGQKKEVEIYRLMTAGTIEEKIYHRQIFKQFLSNKILRDPKQRQTFHLSDLHDLFTLADPSDKTETGALFKGTEIQVKKKEPSIQGHNTPSRPNNRPQPREANFSRLEPIVREEDYAPAQYENQPSAATAESSTGEKSDRLLSAIFSRPDVIHSAHEHDAILASNSRKSTSGITDPEIIAREARKAADKAARELQRAGEIARSLPAGVPTWTGVYGSAGHPDELPARGGRAFGASRRGGPSAASLLGGLAARQGGGNVGAALSSSSVTTIEREGDASGSSSRTGTPLSLHPRGKDFMVLIRDYLKTHGGSCYTQNLIDHFNRFCGTPQRTAEFKEMLRRIAILQKGGSRARAKWVLRKEFGGAAV
jgi:DNA excision repair protein ERCC-6